MKYVAIAFLITILSGSVGAQPLAEYTLKLTPEQLAVTVRALEGQPFRDVAPILNEIQLQIMRQQVTARAKQTPLPDEKRD